MAGTTFPQVELTYEQNELATAETVEWEPMPWQKPSFVRRLVDFENNTPRGEDVPTILRETEGGLLTLEPPPHS